MTCADCTTAAEKPHHGFTNACMGCCARAAGRSPQARKARDNSDKFDRDYRRLLEQFGLNHNQVLQATKADALGGK